MAKAMAAPNAMDTWVAASHPLASRDSMWNAAMLKHE
jgi:hypothetical protein